MDSFRSISLFSGAQGLDIGLGLAGIDIVLGQDIEASCVQTMIAQMGIRAYLVIFVLWMRRSGTGRRY